MSTQSTLEVALPKGDHRERFVYQNEEDETAKSNIFSTETSPSRRDWTVRALWSGHTAEVWNEPNRWSKSKEWRATDHGKSNRPPETHDSGLERRTWKQGVTDLEEQYDPSPDEINNMWSRIKPRQWQYLKEPYMCDCPLCIGTNIRFKSEQPVYRLATDRTGRCTESVC